MYSMRVQFMLCRGVCTVIAVATVMSISHIGYEVYRDKIKPLVLDPHCQQALRDAPGDAPVVEEYNPNIHNATVSPNQSSEIRHIAFLKAHKCASSTMMNIFYRFGNKRNLNFVLPFKGTYLDMRDQRDHVTLIPPDMESGYDILCNHLHQYNHQVIAGFLPSDTVYFAIVREPFQRMYSAFHFYRNVYHFKELMEIKGPDPFETYINDPGAYELKAGGLSQTNNKMARDFGFPLRDYKNVYKFKEHLKKLDKEFNLVIIADLFYESIVLMRRILKWPMDDILFLKINAHSHKTITMKNIPDQLKPYLALDNMLYDHFLSKFKERIALEGPTFGDEVDYFQSINTKTTEFCQRNTTDKQLTFRANDWHDTFDVTRDDCDLLSLHEVPFVNLIRTKHKERLRRLGANVTFLF
ncbi:galactose-3-O-sulfotransferase 2-like [Haliotis cracherodii]|uniref:galactose-3-O-sulfotransferase 2-like n=1 Tax=Haliotis cracherodii TaxID=6455 RepID=UPI0039EA922F